MLNGGPWNFDNAMLLLEPIPTGEDPVKVPLWWLNIWIQIHDLPNGFMSEAAGIQLGNFFGEFTAYDPKNNNSIWRECMRIKIRLDVRKPLKRKKKIKRKNGTEFVVSCKYERLGDFCFACGLVTHTERFCRKFIDIRSEGGAQEWGSWLRAQSRRGASQGCSKWIREEDDVGWTERVGRGNNWPIFQGDNSGDRDKDADMGRESRSNTGDNSKNKSLMIIQGGSNLNGPRSVGHLHYGPGLEEDEELDIETLKRKRTGLDTHSIMDTSDRLPVLQNSYNIDQNKETGFSNVDYTVSNNSEMATLAMQASRPL